MRLPCKRVSMINIFLSWSGTTGKSIATKLRWLLGTQLQGAKPFMSDVDIGRGKQWKDILDKALMETGYGMFIITPDASDSAWMGYEAGAIYTTSKNREIDILPLLFEGQGGTLPTYLSDFQGIEFTKENWKDIFYRIAESIKTIKIAESIKNESSEDDFMETSKINDSFECFWRLFDEDIHSILKNAEEAAKNNSTDGYESNSIKETTTIPLNLRQAILSIQGLSSSFDKILGIEKKIDNLFEQFGDFQSRLTPALTETGLLRTDVAYQSPSAYPSSRLSSSVRRFKDIYAYIQRNDLLDENTLKEMRSILDEMD